MNGSGGTGKSAKRPCLEFDIESADCSASTDLEEEPFSFAWTVNNYSTVSGLNAILSPIFNGGLKSNHQWQLSISPKAKVGFEKQDYTSIYLRLIDFGDSSFWFPSRENKKIRIRFQFTILDENDKVDIQHISSIQDFYKLSSYGWNKFAVSDMLLSKLKQVGRNDCLKMLCRIWIIGELKHEIVKGSPSKSIPSNGPSDDKRDKERESRRATNFGKLFKDSILTDTMIVTNSQSFKAHKAILAASSPVFAARFGVASNALNNVNVAIIGFADDIVKAMLEYIYTGQTNIMKERAPELLQIANAYDLTELKTDTESMIAKSLTVDNAATVLVLAHTCKAWNLKSKVMTFINSHKEAVKNTESFQTAAKDPATTGLFLDLYLFQN